MAAYFFNSNSSLVPGFDKLYDPFLSGFNGVLPGGSVSESLVLDSERGELVKSPVKVKNKKEVSEAKALAALKSHSEAERRRRERINAHLDTLRGLVPRKGKVVYEKLMGFWEFKEISPSVWKRKMKAVKGFCLPIINWLIQMDKATLLAEVISQVKELRKNAMEASKGFLIPMDADEVNVEPYFEESGDANFLFKASICCNYRPELLSDLKQALDGLPLKLIKAEISTLGSRLKNVFVFTGCKEEENIDHAEASHLLANAVHQALSSVLEKASPLPEYSPRTTLPSKRQRISYFESSSSSSGA